MTNPAEFGDPNFDWASLADPKAKRLRDGEPSGHFMDGDSSGPTQESGCVDGRVDEPRFKVPKITLSPDALDRLRALPLRGMPLYELPLEVRLPSPLMIFDGSVVQPPDGGGTTMYGPGYMAGANSALREAYERGGWDKNYNPAGLFGDEPKELGEQ